MNTKSNEPLGRETRLQYFAVDPVSRLHPELFRKQRAFLLDLLDSSAAHRLDHDQTNLLEGIISFLDCVADYAHDAHNIYGCLLFDDEPCCDLHLAQLEADKRARDPSSPLVL